MRSATAPEVPKRSADGIANRDSLTGDRGFESISLQRRVFCEPDFLDQGCARAPDRYLVGDLVSMIPTLGTPTLRL
jgi:hypothetical protein